MTGHFEEKMEISNQFQMMWMEIKKFQKDMKKFGKVLKKDIETINGGERVEYGKDFKNN